MGAILFTDALGSDTLDNGFPAPGDRFRGWTPIDEPIGPLHHALGTGVPYKWVHREDHGARFTIAYIPNESQALAARLVAHLKRGGSVRVETGDTQNNVYDTCYLWPGSTPELSPPDPKDLRRTLTLAILQPGATEPLVCLY
jgi:hypothetical protein